MPEKPLESEDEPGLPQKKIFHGARLTKKEKDEIKKVDVPEE
ncbi:MAG: hypothetical protein ABR999_10835 [Methanoregula sp.]|jgi:hypothetical protein